MFTPARNVWMQAVRILDGPDGPANAAEARDLAEEAIPRLWDEGDGVGLSRCLATAARACRACGDRERAIEYGYQALALQRAHGMSMFARRLGRLLSGDLRAAGRAREAERVERDAR